MKINWRPRDHRAAKVFSIIIFVRLKCRRGGGRIAGDKPARPRRRAGDSRHQHYNKVNYSLALCGVERKKGRRLMRTSPSVCTRAEFRDRSAGVGAACCCRAVSRHRTLPHRNTYTRTESRDRYARSARRAAVARCRGAARCLIVTHTRMVTQHLYLFLSFEDRLHAERACGARCGAFNVPL